MNLKNPEKFYNKIRLVCPCGNYLNSRWIPKTQKGTTIYTIVKFCSECNHEVAFMYSNGRLLYSERREGKLSGGYKTSYYDCP